MKIKINNRNWKIELVSANNKNLLADDGEVCGITHFNESKIYINKEIEKDLMRDTIVHELTHAYLFVYGFGQVESFTEEMVCDSFGAFGYDLICSAETIFKEWDI